MAGDDRTRTEGPDRGKNVALDDTRAAPAAEAAALPARLAPADTLRYDRGPELARGGMGRILKAHDRLLGRTVALKELLAADPGMAARFEREALITARLQHPSIVAVYDAGRTPGGEPFYAMKLVAGRSLKAVIDETTTLDERLAQVPRVIAIAEALAYAHARKVIHRDLKPANVLVGDFGETVVIDWGLAKEVGTAEEPGTGAGAGTGSSSELTAMGSVMGTPAFMPPEQAEGDELDERADVYAIGAILYHVLAGRPPYADMTTTELLGLQVRLGPPTELQLLVPAAPRELVAIAERAMARRPADRYPTAAELAEELKRFQTGQLVAAHRYSRAELVRRWIRRNRLAVSVAASVVAAAAVVGGVSVERILREQDRTAAAARVATERADRLTISEARATVERDPLRALALIAELSPGSPMWGAGRILAAEAQERGLPELVRGPTGRLRALAVDRRRGRVAAGSSDGAVWLWEQPGVRPGRELHRHGREVRSVRFATDGDLVMSIGGDGVVRAWTGGVMRELVTPPVTLIDARPAPDGKTVYVATMNGLARIDVATAESTAIELPQLGGPIRVSPDGARLALAGMGQDALVHELGTGVTTSLTGHTDTLRDLTFAPDGRTVATASRDGTVRVFTPGEAARTWTHGGEVVRIAISPDGRLLASAGADRLIRLWTVATGENVVLAGHLGNPEQLVFSPSGARLASAALDGTVRVWTSDGELVRVLGGGGGTPAVDFITDDLLVTVAETAEVRLWRLDARPRPPARGSKLRTFAVIPGAARIVAGDFFGAVFLWDLASASERELASPDGGIEAIAAEPDGDGFVTLAGGIVRRWDRNGPGRQLPGLAAGLLVVSRDGRRLASSGRISSDVLVWDLADGEGHAYRGHQGWVSALAFSPDGRRLASAAADGTVRLWELGSREVRVLQGHQGGVAHLAFSPDGAHVASAGNDRTVRQWTLATGAVRIHETDAKVHALDFVPGSDALVAADGKQLRIYGAGEEARTLSGHTRAIVSLAFSADGATVASADGATVRVWDLTSGESRVAANFEKAAAVDRVAFVEDTLVVLGDRQIHVLRDELPRGPEALRSWILARLPVTPNAP